MVGAISGLSGNIVSVKPNVRIITYFQAVYYVIDYFYIVGLNYVFRYFSAIKDVPMLVILIVIIKPIIVRFIYQVDEIINNKPFCFFFVRRLQNG